MAKSLRETDPDRYAALAAEASSPFRNMRLFFYAGFGVWGFLGAFIFFFQVLAGRNLETSLPNLLLQSGLVAAMAWLFQREQKAKTEAIATVRQQMREGKYPGDKAKS